MAETSERNITPTQVAGNVPVVEVRAGLTMPSPDAALLDLCDTFHRAHAEAYDETNLYRAWASCARNDTLKELHHMVPATDAGHRAKAAVAVYILIESHENETHGGTPEARFALKLMRDWLGHAGT